MHYLSTMKVPSHLCPYTNPEFITFTTNCVKAVLVLAGGLEGLVLILNFILFKQWTLPQFGIMDAETVDDKTLQQRNYMLFLWQDLAVVTDKSSPFPRLSTKYCLWRRQAEAPHLMGYHMP